MNCALTATILASVLMYCPLLSSEASINLHISFSIEGYGQVEINELSKIDKNAKLLEIKYKESVLIYDNTDVGLQPVYAGYLIDLENGIPVLYLMVDHPGNGCDKSTLKYKLFEDRIQFCSENYFIGNYGHANQVNMWKLNVSK